MYFSNRKKNNANFETFLRFLQTFLDNTTILMKHLIINIKMKKEKVVFRHYAELASKVEALTKEVDSLQSLVEDKALKKWMDTQDVLQILQVGPRTLQNYRDKGQLPYTQVRQKFFYKPEYVERLIKNK